MIHYGTNSIRAFDLNNTWRETLQLVAEAGYDYRIAQGSYSGQLRRQLANLSLIVDYPSTTPLAPIVPFGFPPPTTEEEITNYFCNYLFNDSLSPNEEYTYGQAIMFALPEVIKKLRASNGATNQATINILSEETIYMLDPPCLRVLDFNVVNGSLTLSCFFRSWDVFAALPTNLGGLELLKQHVANELGFANGQLFAYSSGAHIYEQYFDLVNQLNVFKIN